MSIRFGVVLTTIFLLQGCAQVEPLSGGVKDVIAPSPNFEEMTPANGSTNFSGKEIRIPFDEFISLNNPSENIVVIPPDIKPVAKIKNKSLFLSWEEEMQPNTTYAFYLNGAVRDITEQNDSLMSFVFSSGDIIDSLSAAFIVSDAFTKKRLKDQTVGLYQVFNDTVLPNYFGKTNQQGKVVFNYMKAGTYQLVAFNDKNKDLKPQKDESFGFRTELTVISESFVDTIPLLVSPPKQRPGITKLQLLPPGTFALGANRTLENVKLTLNGSPLNEETFIYIEKDSIIVPFFPSDSSSYEVIVQGDDWIDTTSFRMTRGEKDVELTIKPLKTKGYFADEPIVLLANQVISSIDIPKVKLQNSTDSSVILIRNIKSNVAKIELDFERKENVSSILLTIPGYAVLAQNSRNKDTLNFNIDCLSSKEVGLLTVKMEGYETATILELILKDKVVEQVALSNTDKEYLFKNLIPGEYYFRVIIDENANGRWDGGDFGTKKQAEDVRTYSKPKKIRGNWETEIILKENGEN